MEPTPPQRSKQAPDEPAELEHLYRTAPVGLCLMDTDLRYLRINERLANINGKPVSEHLGRTLREVIPQIAPKVEPIFRQVIETGTPVLDLEVHGTTPAYPEKERDWLVSYYPVTSPDGDVQGVSTVVQDITEHKRTEEALREARDELERRVQERTAEMHAANELRRESERQAQEQLAELELLYRTAPLGLCHMDTGLRFLRCNDKLAEINGILAADHLGRTLREIVPEIAETMEPVYRKVIRSGEPVMDVVATGATAADPKTTRHFSACYYPVKSEDGVVQGVSSIVQEITERKRTEESMQRLQNELAHLGRVGTLGEMAATLAHELNQPLAAIGNYTQGCLSLLESQEAKPEELAQIMQRVAGLTSRAGEILQGIRNLVSKREPRRSSVLINDLIREVAALVEPECRSAGATMQLELADRLPPVLADQIQIQQVVLNLVRNALDAMAQSQAGRRVLTIRSGSPQRSTVDVSVSDTGCGFPAEDDETVFEPFFTTKSQGLGMGLAVSRSIINAHEGRIWAEPRPEGTTTFRFTLPVPATEVEDAE